MLSDASSIAESTIGVDRFSEALVKMRVWQLFLVHDLGSRFEHQGQANEGIYLHEKVKHISSLTGSCRKGHRQS